MTTCNHIIEVVQERTLVGVEERTLVIAEAKMGPPGPQGTPGSSSGLFVAKASQPLSGHRVVTLNRERKLRYASSTDVADLDRVVGVTFGAADTDTDCQVISQGEMVEQSWNWDTNLPVYLGTNGLLTQVEPVAPAAKFCMVMGFPISSTSIFINPRDPVLIS